MLATRAALFALFAACANPCVAQQPRELLREQVLRTAERYATFEWTASEANVRHGPDADGVRVDTPDRGFDAAGWLADGTRNRGMPYAWGGFSSIEQFRDGLQQGRFAGLVPTSERARASRFAVGVDCSGYVARCLDLPVKQSTRSLGALCYELDGYDALLPADLLNKHDSHVALFVGWVDAERTKMRVLEAAKLGVEQSTYDAAASRRDGFVAMRFRLLDARWRAMDAGALGEPRWQGSPAAEPMRFVPANAPALRDADAHPLQAAAAGQWVRYTVSDGAARTLLAATASGTDVELQCIETIDGKPLPTGRRAARAQGLAHALVDLLACHEPVAIRDVLAHDVESGECVHGGRTFAARRHTLRLAGETVVRHQAHATWLDVTAVIAGDVPLYGIVGAEFELRIDWALQGRRDGTRPVRITLALDALGTAR